jgi:UDP-N-acetylmuramate dehydrogenase
MSFFHEEKKCFLCGMFPIPNTFQISSTCDQLVELKNPSEIPFLLQSIQKPFQILGGGSNILPNNHLIGTLVVNKIGGIEIIEETETQVFVQVGAGMNWHEWVMFSLQQNWGGLENLALIPGTVGAAPMQNIGAYGVEVKDTIQTVNFYQISKNSFQTISNADAQFGYRTSIFKTQLKNDCLITSVVFKLSKTNHTLHLQYGSIGETLEKKNIATPTLNDVAQAVIEIRQSKLPDPTKIGNAGSFFKNPLVPKSLANELHIQHPEISIFEVNSSESKISAASLIEGCGWKGKIIGNTGTYKNHSLVLVNHGNATGAEIIQLAKDIQASVLSRYGVTIEPEVNIFS